MLALRIKLSGRAPYPTSTKKKDNGRLGLCSRNMSWGTKNMKVQGMSIHLLEDLQNRIICPHGKGKKKGEKTEN
jgi:hypothetical protein